VVVLVKWRWEVLNAIFYVLCEGCRWRALPGDFPAWQTVYTYFRNWRKDGTWLQIHDRLREWTRIEERHPSPSEAVIDSQSVKSAAMVEDGVGCDANRSKDGSDSSVSIPGVGVASLSHSGKCGRTRGANKCSNGSNRCIRCRLTTIWVDGGFDGVPFMQWVMDVCRWSCRLC